MRWQKIARILIAAFVIVFAGIVVYSMRQRAIVAPARTDEVAIRDEKTVIESGKGKLETFKDGKIVRRVDYEELLSYGEGKSKVRGITLHLSDRDGRPVLVKADEADVLVPANKNVQEVQLGKLSGNVRLTTETGVSVTTSEAHYAEAEGVLKMPAPVEFTRGRMKGSSIGATYDKNRDVLLLLDKAHITVAPDASGAGAIDATAQNAGLARADHYLVLHGGSRIVSSDSTAEAVDITMLLDEAGEKIQQMQLREQSRIIGTGEGARSMHARHIDMNYAPDGRTLTSSKLMENGVVELPGASGGANKRIAGVTIDIGMSPDGATVTNLVATDKVQVDLPAEGDTPGRQIKSSSLHAVGEPGQGLRRATFEGGVDFTEVRAAKGKTPAGERRARSLRLIVDTKPGLGPLERADFRGNVRFVDGQTTAEAPQAIYSIDKDLLDLSLSSGDPGTGPLVNNPQLSVEALNIHLVPSTEKLSADTNVRSRIKPRKEGESRAGGAGEQTRVPVMLKQDAPVNVTSNRLEYDGVSLATYTGNALLWQPGEARISADTIALDDRTGSLNARGGVQSTMMLMDADPKTGVKKPTETKASSDVLVYDDAKRLATYTATGETLARLTSAQGDMRGNRIDLFLKESGNELDRAEADGKVSIVLEKLFATGQHLVYTAATETYVLTGKPTVGIQKDSQGACKQSDGTTMTYRRTSDSLLVEGIGGIAGIRSKPLDACPTELRN